MTALGAREPPGLSRARVSGLRVRVQVPTARLLERLVARGFPAGVLGPGGGPARSPVDVELWHVEGGGLVVGSTDQYDLWRAPARIADALLGRPPERGLDSLVRRAAEAWGAGVGSYRELLVAVPGAAPPGLDGPARAVLAMVTDGRLARFADRALGFGLGKQPGVVACEPGGRWEVRVAGRTLLELAPEPAATARRTPLPGARSPASALLGVTPSGRLRWARLTERPGAAPPREIAVRLRLDEALLPLAPARRDADGWMLTRAVQFTGATVELGYPRELPVPGSTGSPSSARASAAPAGKRAISRASSSSGSGRLPRRAR